MCPDTGGSPEASDQSSQQTFLYDAFISYDHDDRAVANGIQRGLHRIGRRVGQLRALRVFRDSTDLTASPDLWGKVTEAMDHSRYIIAVLSPNAAASHWVDKEIDYWVTQRGADQLMMVLAGGGLVWDKDAARFDPARSDAAPQVLTKVGALQAEPLYVDVSDDAPWDPAAALFREKLTDLAAPIHGKAKSDLAGEDLREQHRFRRLRRAAVASLVALTVIALVAATYAFVQRGQAIHQRNEAVAGRLVSEAESMLAGVQEGNVSRAINQILAARKIAERPDEGPTLSALQVTVDQLKIIETSDGLGQLAVSADGSRIMSSGSRTGHFKDSEVTFRDAATGQVTATSPGFAFSADGSRVLSQTDDDHLQVHDTATGQPVGPAIGVSKSGWTATLAFSPDARTVVFARDPSGLDSWDIESGNVRQMTGTADDIGAIVFMPDGRRVVTSGRDGAIGVWDVETGLQLARPVSVPKSAASDLAVSPDGRHLVTEGELSNGIRIWDLESGQMIAHGEQHEPQFGNYVNSLAISRDGRRIVTGSNDRTIQIWDAETAAPIGGPLTGHSDTVDVVTFSADGEQVISRSTDKTIRFWNANPTGTLGSPLPGVHASNVAITRDARRIVWYSDAAINIWDIHTLKPVLPPLVGEVDDFALSHDGSRIAALSASAVTLWDATTGARIREWATNQRFDPIFAKVIFSPDGQKVATYGLTMNNWDDMTSDTSLAVWDAESGTQVGRWVDERSTRAGITSAAFSPDSRQLVHNNGFKVTIVDVASGRMVKKFADEISAEYVGYRPDGEQILAVSANRNGSTMARTINLIDVHSGEIVAEMNDTTKVSAPTFSADGKYIISGHDNDIRVWDAEKHVAIGDIAGGTAQAANIAVSDDNSLIVSNNLSTESGGDTLAELGFWPGPAAWPNLLCAKLAENMSAEDWSEWISEDISYTPVCPDLPRAGSR